MNATDTEFFRAFAGRVRQQLATREGDPTMSATIAETTTTVPPTFQPAPDAPCEPHPWCIETGTHVEHVGRLVEPPLSTVQIWQIEGQASITFGNTLDDYQELSSGDELRAQAGAWLVHAARLGALADEFDAIRETQPQGEQDQRQSPTWTLRTTEGVTVTGRRTEWASNDPSEDAIAPDQLSRALADVSHRRYYPALPVIADLCQNRRDVGEHDILCPQMQVLPFDPDPVKRMPTVSIELTQGSDDWISDLDPAGVTDLAAKLRAHADLLDQVAADLTAARIDWLKNGGQR